MSSEVWVSLLKQLNMAFEILKILQRGNLAAMDKVHGF